MQMNENQKAIIGIGLIIIFFMGAWPPWKHTYRSAMANSEEPHGYAFIAEPPNRPQPVPVPIGYKTTGNSRDRSEDYFKHGVELDQSRLLIQFAATIVIFGGLVLLAAKQKEKQRA